MLKTETNTIAMERQVMGAAARRIQPKGHHRLDTAFEHGQWWVICKDCGASWSVVDAEGGDSINGLDFEQVDHGDDYCQ